MKNQLTTTIALPILLTSVAYTQELQDEDSLLGTRPTPTHTSSVGTSHQLITIIVLASLLLLSLLLICGLIGVAFRLYLDRKRLLADSKERNASVHSNQYEIPLNERSENIHIYSNIDSINPVSSDVSKRMSLRIDSRQFYLSDSFPPYPTFHSPAYGDVKSATLKSNRSQQGAERLSELEQNYTTFTESDSP